MVAPLAPRSLLLVVYVAQAALLHSLASSGGLPPSAPGDAPLVLDPALPPWPTPPVYLGCYHDHDPNVHGNNHEKPPISSLGPRLLRFGVPGCSGGWGCGSNHAHLKSCLPWPSSLAKCDNKKMSQAYCAQICHAWHDSYVYSATAYAEECWCDSAMQNPDGEHRGLATTANECNMPCKGKTTEICGGFWFITIFSVVSPSIIGLVFSGVILVSAASYLGVGILVGRSRGSKGAVLEQHPHYSQMLELRALVLDGLGFVKRAGRRTPGNGSRHSSAKVAYAEETAVTRRPSKGGGGGGGDTTGKGEKTHKSKKGGKKEKSSKGTKKGEKTKRESKTPLLDDTSAPRSTPTVAAAEQSDGRQETDMTDAYGRTLRR